MEACTRNPQEVILNMGSKGLKLVDVPGVGESQERDEEYDRLYAELLPELDLVLWLIMAWKPFWQRRQRIWSNVYLTLWNEKEPDSRSSQGSVPAIWLLLY